MRSGQGGPDEARAARYILKDYVNAHLLFCHPPPDIPAEHFNKVTRALQLRKILGKKPDHNAVAKELKNTGESDSIGSIETQKNAVLDDDYFANSTSLPGYVLVRSTGMPKVRNTDGTLYYVIL